MKLITCLCSVIVTVAMVAVFVGVPVAIAWEPTKPIEFVIPAGTGGGADQMARLMAGISDKHKLAPELSSSSTSPGAQAPKVSCT